MSVKVPVPIVTADPHALALSIRASCLVFEDPASRALLERVRRIAPSDATALIIGETGTGKELIARHIHELSDRRSGPFVAFNCAAVNESLLESELFGHERGAFTGAVTAKAGWFETAQGGSLFLDEIGDLSLALQAKLLRVIQEREVVRVGSRQPIAIDVRLIAATNVNLEEAVAAGRFRDDLYYRLNVATIELPPLRARPGDILPLAHHFLNTYGSRLGFDDVELASETGRVLLDYPWPGNIRELENAIHHALLVCPGHVVRPEDLRLPAPRSHVLIATGNRKSSSSHGLAEALTQLFNAPNDDPDRPLYHEIDRTVIRTAFEYCERNQLRTARLLGISRNIVRDRLIRHGLLSSQKVLS
ncbi:MAG: sigma-54-dependent Fis family transcriptional regulator [Nitrospira sp.]|nr:sigma-54-dependent Fis family transcriptional regulator [Nitrospira sp.]